uniref:Uncharacterized protein n=1 Tax=Arion vulgaris TaxID=1028688 RepID=A0A0B6YKA6_9EUPU
MLSVAENPALVESIGYHCNTPSFLVQKLLYKLHPLTMFVNLHVIVVEGYFCNYSRSTTCGPFYVTIE